MKNFAAFVEAEREKEAKESEFLGVKFMRRVCVQKYI
jgi:hypothetical protein